MLFVKGNDLVNCFFRGTSSPLAFADRFWIPPSLRYKIHDVKHIDSRTNMRAESVWVVLGGKVNCNQILLVSDSEKGRPDKMFPAPRGLLDPCAKRERTVPLA